MYMIIHMFEQTATSTWLQNMLAFSAGDNVTVYI